ncbi:RNA polymerase sigma-70 factor (ECF subfamily) [Breznakibacter xylanolyticus]|uniref:RNA polymerase sigma-70 factor (ECF subfamily) n=1 Tax=Breznakibacter xylanolyticus TaxID=990 RepID=A0A2W7MXP5_9BACT|nr:RNA polymerase sigma factor [Breznakibacter xylanolyticus]MBN2744790.1 RNA polymerase sigma factor [Marinilabiliaceae bacterium]PZX12935.1 RNA polymerase sigma-70 factor (ECF subfamily) [Breznakibacter xylanolyticus]
MEFRAFSAFTDEQILHEIVHNHRHELFEVLYKRYFPKVVDKCYSFLKKRSLAHEVANDVMSKTYEKLGDFKHNATFSSWLYSITYNYCIDYLRLQKKLHYPQWNQDNELPEIIDETEEDVFEVNFHNLMTILESVHPEEKAMILMKYQDNLSIKEISVALRVSESACKMRLKRAKARVLYLYKEKFKE